MKLICSTGETEASPGDRFFDNGTEWEVIGFTGSATYSPSNLGGTPDVLCKPLTDLSGWWKQWVLADGNIVWCGDSVAAAILACKDGKNRSARGDVLTK